MPAVGMNPAAKADESQYEEFYSPPAALPDGEPGDLIRLEPSRLVLEPSGQVAAYLATGISRYVPRHRCARCARCPDWDFLRTG